MNLGMPRAEAPKLFLGMHARLAFPKEEGGRAIPDPMQRFSNAARFAYDYPKALHAPERGEDLVKGLGKAKPRRGPSLSGKEAGEALEGLTPLTRRET
jgi:hypothetical protein